MPDMTEMIHARMVAGREYRNIAAGAIQTRAEEDQGKIVEGYATTFEQPYVLWQQDRYTVMEVIDRAACEGADMSDVIMQYDHMGRVFARQSNRTLELLADDHGLHIRADLGGTELGRQIYEEIRKQYTDKMSFAFSVARHQITKEENDETGELTVTRRIIRIRKIYDVSAVSIPANGTTEISARTCAEGVIRQVLGEIEEKRAREKEKLRIYMEVTKL